MTQWAQWHIHIAQRSGDATLCGRNASYLFEIDIRHFSARANIFQFYRIYFSRRFVRARQLQHVVVRGRQTRQPCAKKQHHFVKQAIIGRNGRTDGRVAARRPVASKLRSLLRPPARAINASTQHDPCAAAAARRPRRHTVERRSLDRSLARQRNRGMLALEKIKWESRSMDRLRKFHAANHLLSRGAEGNWSV